MIFAKQKWLLIASKSFPWSIFLCLWIYYLFDWNVSLKLKNLILMFHFVDLSKLITFHLWINKYFSDSLEKDEAICAWHCIHILNGDVKNCHLLILRSFYWLWYVGNSCVMFSNHVWKKTNCKLIWFHNFMLSYF